MNTFFKVATALFISASLFIFTMLLVALYHAYLLHDFITSFWNVTPVR
jgi:hypothetical protein